jgi:hypothetical protein
VGSSPTLGAIVTGVTSTKLKNKSFSPHSITKKTILLKNQT